jgi:DNA-binding MarR family transcriptional regulator
VNRRAVPRVTRPPETGDNGSPPQATPTALPSRALDPVIHERLRLAIVHALAVNPSLTFTQLKQLLGMTDGNLSVHARRLEEVGYVESHKTTVGRSSQTRYVLTPAGRRALTRYLDHLEAIIATVRPALRRESA